VKFVRPGFDWVDVLTSNLDLVTPHVSWFRHVPLSETWASEISIGMKVNLLFVHFIVLQLIISVQEEVKNKDTRPGNGASSSYWLATIIKINGYKALLRYEGFNEDASNDFWVNVADNEVYHVGYYASFKKTLIPP